MTESQSWIVGEVEYHDFMPFAHAVVDFSRPGLTAVEGVVTGRRGCNNNGAGKSALIEGIVWCLYDRCLRERYKGNDVIRKGAEKTGAYVRVTLSNGVDTVSIIRRRGHPVEPDGARMMVNGEDISPGTNPVTNDVIARTLGVDFFTFCNTIAFGAREDVRGFFAATDSQRKDVLDSLLGLNTYAAAGAAITQHVKDVAAEISSREEAMRQAEEEASRLRDAMDRFTSPEFVEQLESQAAEAKLAVLAARKAVVVTTATAEEARTAWQAAVAANAYEQASYQKALGVYNVKTAELRVKLDAAMRAVGKAEQEYAAATRYGDSIKGMVGKPCPTCKQPVTQAHAGKVAAHVKQVSQSAGHTMDCVKLEADQIKAELAGLECPAAVDAYAVLTAKGNYDAAMRADQQARDDLAAAVREATERSAAHLNATATLSRVKDDVAKAEAAAEEIRVDIQRLSDRADVLNFWAEGFGNGGVRSFLIEAQLATINATATGYAARLLGEGASVRLSAVRALKTRDAFKEELTVHVDIPGMAQKFAGASKGQKARLDLSILLAFRDVGASRNPRSFGQVFADELFDGLDEAGADAVTSLLRETADQCPVLLVTHDPRLKSVADRVLTVTHDGDSLCGCATVSQNKGFTDEGNYGKIPHGGKNGVPPRPTVTKTGGKARGIVRQTQASGRKGGSRRR